MMLANCGSREDFWEFLEQQRDQISQSKRKSTLNIHWKNWCWSWSYDTCGHLMWKADPLEKTLMLEKTESRIRRGQQWISWLGDIIDSEDIERKRESEVAQSCLPLCNPMDCSLPGSSIHGIFQARILEWFAISFSRGSSQPGDRTQVSLLAGRYFTIWATRKTMSFRTLEDMSLSKFWEIMKDRETWHGVENNQIWPSNWSTTIWGNLLISKSLTYAIIL